MTPEAAPRQRRPAAGAAPAGEARRGRRSAACLIAAGALVAAGAGAGGAAAAAGCDPARVRLDASGGPVVFAVEIADDPAEMARGLMFRDRLAREAGMLFVYDPPQPATFWMKNTMIPLDMVFIDDAGRVLNVEAGAVPYSLAARSSSGPVRAVLEINGGLAAELGIGPGTQAAHPAFAAAPAGGRCAD